MLKRRVKIVKENNITDLEISINGAIEELENMPESKRADFEFTVIDIKYKEYMVNYNSERRPDLFLSAIILYEVNK